MIEKKVGEVRGKERGEVGSIVEKILNFRKTQICSTILFHKLRVINSNGG